MTAQPGQASAARFDGWAAWEVFTRPPHWRDAKSWGIASAAAGGPPWLLSGGADEVNEARLKLHEGETFDELVLRLGRAQEQLVRAALAADDLDAAASRRQDGGDVTVRQRLETIARH